MYLLLRDFPADNTIFVLLSYQVNVIVHSMNPLIIRPFLRQLSLSSYFCPGKRPASDRIQHVLDPPTEFFIRHRRVFLRLIPVRTLTFRAYLWFLARVPWKPLVSATFAPQAHDSDRDPSHDALLTWYITLSVYTTPVIYVKGIDINLLMW